MQSILEKYKDKCFPIKITNLSNYFSKSLGKLTKRS